MRAPRSATAAKLRSSTPFVTWFMVAAVERNRSATRLTRRIATKAWTRAAARLRPNPFASARSSATR
jgi:hypothetical protein